MIINLPSNAGAASHILQHQPADQDIKSRHPSTIKEMTLSLIETLPGRDLNKNTKVVARHLGPPLYRLTGGGLNVAPSLFRCFHVNHRLTTGRQGSHEP